MCLIKYKLNITKICTATFNYTILSPKHLYHTVHTECLLKRLLKKIAVLFMTLCC